MPDRKIYTLLQINQSVKRAIENATDNNSFWIRTEITSIDIHKKSGHYYLNLAHTYKGMTVAKARAQIWDKTAQNLKRQIGNDFDNILKQGSEVLILCKVRFHQIYGYSIIIEDVDKEFALGKIEAQKKECFEKLTREGIINLNKHKSIPYVIQHIIVLGSKGTAGVTDFEKQIIENKHGYIFDFSLVNIQVQGDGAKRGIINALTKTSAIVGNVLIVILRGGGSKLDLHIFNDYDICKLITQHQVPVFTAIGHEIDQSVCDLVANTPHKTPSAVGSFIIDHNLQFETKQQTKWIMLKDLSLHYYKKQHNWLTANSEGFKTKVISYTQLKRGSLHHSGQRLVRNVKQEINNSSNLIQLQFQSIKNITVNKINEVEPSILRNSLSILKGETRRLLNTMHAINENRRIDKVKVITDKLFIKERRRLLDLNTFVDFASPTRLSDRGFGIIMNNEKILRKTDALNEGNYLSIKVYGRKFVVTFRNYS